MRLTWIDPPLSVCRVPAGSPLPEWATRQGAFFCAARSQNELSIVCEADLVPHGVENKGPMSAFRVSGALDFSLVGVLTSLLVPLAEAAISVFVVSTYDTDYVLVGSGRRDEVVAALAVAGHDFA